MFSINNHKQGGRNVPPGHAKKNKKPPPGQAKKDCSDDSSTDPNNGNGPDIPPGELKKIKYESGYRYILKDHLGSTDVILDGKGKVVQRMSFDPWGASRNQDWSHSAKTVESVALSGFTGHEAMQPVGLIHMNGRVYDPILGRFTSTDPIIESVNQMQTYNRYSYVLNNPLKYTDPTGYITSQTCPLSGHNCQEVGKNGQHCYCTPISRPPPATPAPGTHWTLTDANGNILYQGQNPDFNLLDDGGFSYTDLYGGLVSVAYDPGVNVFTVSYVPSYFGGYGNDAIFGNLGYGALGGLNRTGLGTGINSNLFGFGGIQGITLTHGIASTEPIQIYVGEYIYVRQRGIPGGQQALGNLAKDLAKQGGKTIDNALPGEDRTRELGTRGFSPDSLAAQQGYRGYGTGRANPYHDDITSQSYNDYNQGYRIAEARATRTTTDSDSSQGGNSGSQQSGGTQGATRSGDAGDGSRG